MQNSVRIEPCLDFVKELQATGGVDLKNCYQCATCSVVCPLSPAENPYPRKEMIWAQWGLEEKLTNDIDIWLCHNCGNCSDLCPRNAKPADLMSAARNMTYRKLVHPEFIGKWMSSLKYLPLLAGIPMFILGLIWFLRAMSLGTFFPLTDGKIVYSGLFPGDLTIDPLFGLTFVGVCICFGVGIRNLLNGLKKHTPKTFVIGYEQPTLLQAIVATIKDEILLHRRFYDCGDGATETSRAKGHLFLFYGFVCCLIVTSIVASAHWGGKIIPLLAPIGHTPMVLWNPVKVLANVGAFLLAIGLTLLTLRRLGQDSTKKTSNYYDWYLLGIIWSVTLTGIGSEIFRLLAFSPELAFSTYYFHLVSIWMLFAYLPWSKLGHLVYRTTALVYARYVGRLPIKDKLIKEDNIFVI